HTRFSRDWSSDVCSSDLLHDQFLVRLRHGRAAARQLRDGLRVVAGLGYGLVEDRRVRGDAGQAVALDELAQRAVQQPRAPYLVRSEERRVGKEGRSPWAT